MSVTRTLADGLYFNARATPRCNLYLITAGNILDLKSFLVKYRNIKETPDAPPQGERTVEGNDLPFMNSLRLPGRLENPRSCSHLSPLFLFHSSPWLLLPFFPTVLSISFRSTRTFVSLSHPLVPIFPSFSLSRSHLTIFFYSFHGSVDQLRKLLKPFIAALELSVICLSIITIRENPQIHYQEFRQIYIKYIFFN